jgi:hypothetical protein
VGIAELPDAARKKGGTLKNLNDAFKLHRMKLG